MNFVPLQLRRFLSEGIVPRPKIRLRAPTDVPPQDNWIRYLNQENDEAEAFDYGSFDESPAGMKLADKLRAEGIEPEESEEYQNAKIAWEKMSANRQHKKEFGLRGDPRTEMELAHRRTHGEPESAWKMRRDMEDFDARKAHAQSSHYFDQQDALNAEKERDAAIDRERFRSDADDWAHGDDSAFDEDDEDSMV